MAIKKVALPNGETVVTSTAPLPWWNTHGGAGYIDPKLLAPDPSQPRKFMGKARLIELVTSVGERGVRTDIVVTPLSSAPWAKVLPEHRACPFLIVSGHRRTHAAISANLGAVPIVVRTYPNEKEHRSDVSLLNKGQDPLSELEEGLEILALRKAGWSHKELTEHYGWNQLTIQSRINLTRLHPSIQNLLSPELPEKLRLIVTTAQNLGAVRAVTTEELEKIATNLGEPLEALEFKSDDDRRFALQRLLLTVIQKRHLNGVRSTELIKELTLPFKKGGHSRAGVARYQPVKRVGVLENLFATLSGSVVIDWTPAEFERILANSSLEQVDELLKQADAAADTLSGIATMLRRIKGKKKPTSPEVAALISKSRMAGAR